MANTTRVAIFGAGQIGRAVYEIINNLKHTTQESKSPYIEIEAFVIDGAEDNISKLVYGTHVQMDLGSTTVEEISTLLKSQQATHVFNALPFSFNEKIAKAAVAASCAYIDFTEDDVMADKVQAIYSKTDLNCAVKCGLAPGFINYIGYNLVAKIHTPQSLMVSVGALPKNVSFNKAHPERSYNLTWSVDGLVNEYIRPCRIRKDGLEKEIQALGDLETVIVDGIEYEAAHTSGGVGSLIKDLLHVPNVHYMTLRYPGHYRYVKAVVQDNYGDFDKIRDIFARTFPTTDEDVIIVYANAFGMDTNGNPMRRSYSNKFYGTGGLTGIQSTTAGSGVAMLEMMIKNRVVGTISHSDVDFQEFLNTEAFKGYYKTK